MVVLEHIEDGLPQQLQVFLRETGDLAGQIGRDEAFCTVEGVRYDILAPHLGPLLFGVRLGGDGHAGNGDFLRHNGVDAAGKTKLYRAAHLAAVERAFDERGHHRAEGADVKKVLAHEIADLSVQRRVVFFGGFQVFVYAQIGQRFGVAALQRHLVLDVDAITGGVLLGSLDIIADLAFEADVGHKTVAGLGVDAGHVARVGVAVGVSVFNVEQDDKIVPVFDGLRHFSFPPFWRSVFGSRGNNRSGKRSVPAGSCGRAACR